MKGPSKRKVGVGSRIVDAVRTQSGVAISRVGRAMRAEFDTLLAAIADRVAEAISSYAVVDPTELRERIAQTVSTVIQCLTDGRPPSQEELDSLALAGERRAVQGVPAAALIQSFRIAERTLLEELQGWCTRMQVRPGAARTARAEVITALDLLEQAMFASYSNIQQQIDTAHRLSESTLLTALARGETVDTAEVIRLANAVGVTGVESREFVGLALGSVGDEDRIRVEQRRHRFAAELSRDLDIPVISGLVTSRDRRVALLVVPWSDRTVDAGDLIDVVRRTISPESAVGVGSRMIGPAGLAGTCLGALDALDALLSFAPEPRTDHQHNLLPDILLRREPALADQLADRVVGPLAGTDLLETLRAHLDSGLSLSATATRLGVHRNTIQYRLSRFADLTGLDLHDPRDLAAVVWGLQAHRGRHRS